MQIKTELRRRQVMAISVMDSVDQEQPYSSVLRLEVARLNSSDSIQASESEQCLQPVVVVGVALLLLRASWN